MVELSKKRREKDNNNCYDDDEENDPVYVFFLSCLKGHGKSYILECEEKGLPVSIEYEVDSGSDEACDLEPKRKLRSAMKQNKDSGSDEVCDLEPKRKLRSAMKQNKDLGSDEVCDLEPKRILRSAMKHNKVPLVENPKKIEMVNGKQIKSKCKSEKKRKVKSNPNMETEPDYLIFLRNLKPYDDGSLVYNNGNHTVVYSMMVGKNSHVKEEDNDGSFSGVTILDCLLSEEENPNFSTINNRLDIMDYTSRCDYEFRQKVIAVLRKPYNEEEYDRLWEDVGRRKAIGGRHLDLRQGRERPCSLKKEGKSYLDHYPGLEIKLLQAQDDKTKCLNLLRGFFLWLKVSNLLDFLHKIINHVRPIYGQRTVKSNLTNLENIFNQAEFISQASRKLPGPFCPWEDTECLAVTSESS